ncbi:MAG: hypothetical protein JSW50_15685 [Candidatus Latescibacterota bacterium]|nr:MAG: hypothetical protein JSW50_15685 [Candidatus Latescibacterota bacterium]
MNSSPNQILTAFADRVVQYVRDAVGDGNILTAFLAGGVARDEISVAIVAGHTEIYSDIDLYIVVSDEVDVEHTNRQTQEYAASLPRAADEFTIYPSPDVGVYSAEDLRAQTVRPGTVEIRSAHRVLAGSLDITRLTDRFVATAIDPKEGMYLLENRLSEISAIARGLCGGAGSLRYAHYTLLKGCQDLLSAVLITLGQFKESRAKRMETFETKAFRKNASGMLDDNAMESIAGSYRSLLRLQNVIDIQVIDLEAKRRHVEALLLETWRRLAARIYGGEQGVWADVVERRCRVQRWMTNTRELLVLGKRMGVSRGGLAIRLGRIARFSPVEVLRLSGLVDLVLQRGKSGDIELEDMDRQRLLGGYVSVLERLTGSFGVEGGSVFDRGRGLFRRTT